MHIVFLYKLVDTYGIGILPLASVAVIQGAKQGWVMHLHVTGADRYFIEDVPAHVRYCEKTSEIGPLVERIKHTQGLKLADNPMPPPPQEITSGPPLVFPGIRKNGRGKNGKKR